MKRLLLIAAASAAAFAVGVFAYRHLRRERTAGTPLARAAQSGDSSSVKNLIAQGADVNARDAQGFTPLAYAARAGDAEVIKSLADAGADVNARDCTSNGWTPLINAIHRHQPDAARLLVERGADVNERAGVCAAQKIESGMTPLMFAAMYDDEDAVRLLLEHGADPRAKDGDNSALSYAVAGASLGRLSDIDRAAAQPCPVETVRLLLRAAPDAQLNGGVIDRAMMYVARKKCPEVARLLAERTSANNSSTRVVK